MPIDFTTQAFDALDQLGETYEGRRVTAEIIGLLDDPEPPYSVVSELQNARRVRVVGHVITYRYLRELALIQVIEIEAM